MLKSIILLLISIDIFLISYHSEKANKKIKENAEAIDDTLVMLLNKGE